MAVALEKAVPFGRSLDEHRRMFSLSEYELGRKMPGVGDGPASCNAESSESGYSVTSLDPVYQFSAAKIKRQFYAAVDLIVDQVKASSADWVWTIMHHDALRSARVRVSQRFLGDYEKGKKEGRYLVGCNG